MYLEKLPKKFMFERILKSLGSRFLKQTMGYNTSKKQFSFDESLVSLFPQKDQEKNFYDILYDERIINKTSSHNDRYSFTYDRFFEYILGLSIIELYELDEGFDTSKIVNILNESKGEFHLIQGLKSALVNISCNYIDSPNRSSLLTDISRLRELLNIENNDVKLLIKDTLQEILVENGGEGFDFIEEAFNDKEQFLEFIVEYCSDNLHAVSFLIETILSGNKNGMKSQDMVSI